MEAKRCTSFLVSWGGVRRPLIGLWHQSRMTDECETAGGMRIDRGNRRTQRKFAPVPLYSQQTPHDLTLARTRAAAVGSRRLTALAMTVPLSSSTVSQLLKATCPRILMRAKRLFGPCTKPVTHRLYMDSL
jgi:hypothetical protein